MKPHVDSTVFGSITIDGTVYEHDVMIAADGTVSPRRKELSRQVTGTSHVLSAEEVADVLGGSAERLIIGTGQAGALRLSDEATAFLAREGVASCLAPTPEAIERYNAAGTPVAALFHVTC